MPRSVPTTDSVSIDDAEPRAPAGDDEAARTGAGPRATASPITGSDPREARADEARIALVEEQLVVSKETHETGRVVVRTHTHETTETVEETLRREEVGIERVAVGRVVTEAEGPRQEDDTWIVPIYEERLVVRRELVLTEELHVRRERRDEEVRQTIPVRRQEAVVTRIRSEARKASDARDASATAAPAVETVAPLSPEAPRPPGATP